MGAVVTLEVVAGVLSLSSLSELRSASALRFFWKSRRRDMKDKNESTGQLLCRYVCCFDDHHITLPTFRQRKADSK